jgi:UDP-N-acetylmuramoyl-L-alanyl-D-glutamate--2,6-diaminopimelate ligase
MKLVDLIKQLPHHRIIASQTSPDQIQISAITSDSRKVKPGALFVAYRGVYTDGHRFIPDANQRGAVAVIVEDGYPLADIQLDEPLKHPIISVPSGREALAHLSAAWYGYPARQLTMVGITGTDGKTTTTNFLFHILRHSRRRTGMISTVNALIGKNTHETGLHTTTPDAPDVQRYLAQMVADATEICLLETTSHGLAQHRVTACDFDVAIVTNITHEHLDLHGSLAEYRAAKATLFEGLATATQKGIPKTAILNSDDWSFEYLKARLSRGGTRWLGYSTADHPEATVKAHNIQTKPSKTEFTIQGPAYAFAAHTTLVGYHNVSNCLAAVTAAVEVLDVSPAEARAGIAALPGVPGRMERIDEGQPFLAVVDFAHTPNSLRQVLTTARRLSSGRIIVVFGCAGLRDVEKRTLMGETAAELADHTIITAEDPRTESLDDIIAHTARAVQSRGGIEGITFEKIPDRGRAIYRAVQMAGAGDIVLALGKGHEQSMCFGNIEYNWDDREALRTALRGRPLLTLPTAWS